MVSSSFMSLYARRGTILTLSQKSGYLDGPTDLQAEATDFQIKSTLCCHLVSVIPNKGCRLSLFQSCGFETPILIITYFSFFTILCWPGHFSPFMEHLCSWLRVFITSPTPTIIPRDLLSRNTIDQNPPPLVLILHDSFLWTLQWLVPHFKPGTCQRL